MIGFRESLSSEEIGGIAAFIKEVQARSTTSWPPGMPSAPKAEVVGLSLSVINAPDRAKYWYVTVLDYPAMDMKQSIPLRETWVYTGNVPRRQVQFVLMALPWETGRPVQFSVVPFRFDAGKSYIWDFDRHVLSEK
jgi:hypothetical protein